MFDHGKLPRMRTLLIILLFATSAFAQSPGDPARGKDIFEGKGNCLTCHRVNGNGSRTGPDLSDVGLPRPGGGVGPGFGGTAAGNAKNLETALLDPDAEIAISNRSVRVVTRAGATVTGRMLNQDSATVQVIDEQGKLKSFIKSDLREFTILTKSPMPSYKGKLNDQEVADTIAYLMSLKGSQGVAPVVSPNSISGGVTFQRILNAAKEPQNWLTYSGGVNGHRHSVLTQITPANVKNLELQWVWQAKSLEKFETTALVVDGVLYTVEAPDTVVALDAVTGRLFWTFPYTPAAGASPCCGRVNRGLAILGDTLFYGTIDAHLIALDSVTGKVVWNTGIPIPAEGDKNRYGVTHAPLVVKDKFIIGTTGGDGAIRGFVDAYDAKTGKQAWRFYTIPAPGEPGSETWPAGDRWKTGGGAVWNIGAYDPDSNLTFWGVGNPSDSHNPDKREGDNLYTNSVVALNADTGKLKWHYQFTPHDDMDWDATQVPVLADIQWQGRTRKAMLWANRNGVMYVLDRTTGEFLAGRPFVEVNWLAGFDAKGRPQRVPGKVATPEGSLVMPTVLGATNWYPPSYSPSTGLFYIAGWENSGTINYLGKRSRDTGITPMPDVKLLANPRMDSDAYGVVRAFDPTTGQKKWEYKMGDTTWAGVLTTASDLLFSGGRDGYFFALNAKTGELLWRMSLGGQVNSGPMTYSVNGKQYVAIAAGTSLFAFALK